MAKAYWIGTYRSVSNPDALAAYARLGGPALTAAGGRILARGMPEKVYEAGLEQRCVLIEFESVEAALAAHDSPQYQKALEVKNDPKRYTLDQPDPADQPVLEPDGTVKLDAKGKPVKRT